MGRIVTVSDSAGRSVTVPNRGVAQTSRHHIIVRITTACCTWIKQTNNLEKCSCFSRWLPCSLLLLQYLKTRRGINVGAFAFPCTVLYVHCPRLSSSSVLKRNKPHEQDRSVLLILPLFILLRLLSSLLPSNSYPSFSPLLLPTHHPPSPSSS